MWGFISFLELISNFNILLAWILLLWVTLLTFPLKKLQACFPSKAVRLTLHFGFLAFVFVNSVWVIWKYDDWHFVPKGSLTCQLVVLLLKMHSFLIYDPGASVD